MFANDFKLYYNSIETIFSLKSCLNKDEYYSNGLYHLDCIKCE